MNRNHSGIAALCACLLFSTLPRTALAQTPQKLSLADAVRLATSESALAASANARVNGADAKLRGAKSYSNPVLIVSHPAGQNTGAIGQDYQLTQTIELGDRRRQTIRAAQSDQRAAQSDRAAVLLQLTFDAQSVYYEALRADVERDLAATALANAIAFATAAETQFQAGDAPRSNVVRSGIERARAEQALQAAETDRENRYAELRSLLHLDDAAPIALTDTLAYVPAVYPLPALQTLALKNRPDILSAQYARDSRNANLHNANVAGQPDLFIEAIHANIDPSIGGNSLRVGITLPLFDWGRNRADSQAARAAVQEQEANLAEVQRLAKLEVATANRNLAQSRNAVESFRAGRLDRAKELLDMAQIGYQQGANSYLELLDAQQVYRSEQAEYARALAAYSTSRAALQKSVGGILP